MALSYTNIFTDIGLFIKLTDELRFIAKGTPLGVIAPTDLAGAHTGGTSTTTVTRAAGTWTASELIGLTIHNVNETAVGVITSNTTGAATMARGLSGPNNNDWVSGDVFEIDYPNPNMPWTRDAIFTQLEASGKENLLDGMFSLFDGQRDSMVSLAAIWAGKVNTRLLDRETVINELVGVVSTSGLSDVLIELYRQMLQDSQHIRGSSISAQAWSAESDNVGEATIANQTALDGFSSPGSGFSANPFYADITTPIQSNLAVPSETMTLTVTTDRDTDGVTAGHESWLLEGQPGPSSALGWRTEGSGTSITIPTLNSYSTIANRDFETFSGGIPTSWTLESGSAGTELNTETTAADVYRGSSAIRMDGTGTDVEIRQAVANQAIDPHRWYQLTVQIHTDGNVDGTGALDILFISDSGEYTAGSGEKISMDTTELNNQNGATKSGWHEQFRWLTPKVIPDDLELSIKFSNADSAGEVHIDSIAFGPFIYGNGVGFTITARETDKQLSINDRYTTPISNDEGIIQRFFRRHLKFQLPFVTDNTETLTDDLAT